jgi:ankyrin repeat protein
VIRQGEQVSPAILNEALVGAARGGHVGVVKCLLSHGADVERSSTADGMTALDAAVRHGHRDVAASCFPSRGRRN